MDEQKSAAERMEASLDAVAKTKPHIDEALPVFMPPKPITEAAKKSEVQDAFSYATALRLAFLGAGQGGGRMANSFYTLGYRRVGIFNLTDSDFQGLHPDVPKLSLNVGGARKDTSYAAEMLRHNEERVWDLLERSWDGEPDVALVCVGLGGGSGSGTAPRLVEIAREYMQNHARPVRVGAIVSLPTVPEGQKVCLNAVNTFRALLDMEVSPLIVVDNERIQRVFHPPMGTMHHSANEMVSTYLHIFNRLAGVQSDLSSFDPSELLHVLDSGIVVMGAVHVGTVETIHSPADVSEAIRTGLGQSILAEVDYRKSRIGACIFTGDDEVMSKFPADYINAGLLQLKRLVGSAYKNSETPVVIHPGIYRGGATGLQAYTMIGGLEPPMQRLANLAQEAGLMRGRQPMELAKYFGLDDAE